MFSGLKSNAGIILVLLISCIFAINLGGQDLSLDEPDTIAVARTIGTYGIPSAWDGLAFIDVEHNFTRIGETFVWTWHPWLQHYITYATLSILGNNVDIGLLRLPFALFGIATVLFSYLLAKRVYKNNLTALFVAIGLVSTLTFFLHVRQIRYYAPTAFFSTVVAYYFICLVQDRRFSKLDELLYAISFTMLFLSNYVAWFSSAVLLIGLSVLKKRHRVLSVSGIVCTIAVLWYIYFRPYSGDVSLFTTTVTETIHRVISYVLYTNHHVFSALMLVASAIIAVSKRNVVVLALGTWIVVKIGTYSIFQSAQGRYLVDVIPVVLVFGGYVYDWLISKNKTWLAVGVFLTLVTTNLFSEAVNITNASRQSIQFKHNAYVVELTKSYESPMKQIGTLLSNSYQPGDLFWSNRYPYNIYLASGVPPLYSNCQFAHEAPEQSTDVNNLKWIILFDTTTDDLDTHCMADLLQSEIHHNFRKVSLDLLPNTVHVNDVDVVIRRFPPRPVKSGDITILERVETNSE